jgi:predicted RND superfamily exporter protein
VPIVVDTNQIFSSVNSWIVTFVPIVAIGLGIAIALAILTFIGKQILNAFQGGGRK